MRTLFWCLLTLILCSSARADDWMHAGDEAYARCDLAAAIDSYRAVLKADPNRFDANWKLARALNDRGTLMKRSDAQKACYVEAESLSREAIRLNPNDASGYVFLAISEGKEGLFEGGKKKVELGKDVKKQAEKAVELNPKSDLA